MKRVSHFTGSYMSQGYTFICNQAEFNTVISDDSVIDGDTLLVVNGNAVAGYYIAFEGNWVEL